MSGPYGPRIRPRIIHDDEGQLIIFTGKACEAVGCGLALTSRNRWGERLLCIEHGKERERARVRGPRQRKPAHEQAAATATRAAAAGRRDDHGTPQLQPLPLGLHVALVGWLNDPGTGFRAALLKLAMDDYELNWRLRGVLPASTDSPQSVRTAQVLHSIPVEEPTFTDPNHRTTHGEFLADCSTYGA